MPEKNAEQRAGQPARFGTSSIRFRLMSALGAMTLVLLIFCAAAVIFYVYSAETSAWRGRQAEAARLTASTVATFLQRAEATTTYITLLDPDLLAEYPAILRQILEVNDTLLEIVRLDASGAVLADAHRVRSGLASQFTIPMTEWFQRARAGERYYGDLQIVSIANPYVTLALPTGDGGVVAARLHMRVLWDVVRDIRFGASGQAYIIGPDGRIMAHSNTTLDLTRSILQEQPDLYARMQAQAGSWSGAYVNFRGEPVVGLSVPIGRTGWIMVTEMAQAEAYAASRSALIVVSGGLLVLMILAIGLARSLLNRAVWAPIDRLRAGAEAIGRGDLEHRIAYGKRNEIGQVAAAFDSMAAQLGERARQLEAQAAALAAEVTERILAEEALRRSEARYRGIVQDQTEHICRFVRDGTLTFVNDAFCRYFGKSREDLEGRTFAPLIAEEDRALVEAQIAALTPDNPVATREHRVFNAQGELRWILRTDRLLPGAEGAAAEYQSVGWDVTEQRQAEEALRQLNAELERRVAERTEELVAANRSLLAAMEVRKQAEELLSASERRLNFALNAARAGAWEWDAATGQAIWSEGNFRLMGLDPATDAANYATWLRAVHPDDRPAAEAAAAQALEERSNLSTQFRVVWPDGTVRWLLDAGGLLYHPDGQPRGMYGVQIDITERQEAIEKIKAALQEKEILLKEVHHRVKNNMQIFSSLLSMQAEAVNDPAVLALFEDSQNRIRSMALVHERLYRSGDLGRIDLGVYLRELTASLARAYRQKVELQVEAQEVHLDIDRTITCGLIVNELVSNALKHAFPGGRKGQIGIRLDREEDGTQIHLAVWDDGVGIPATFDLRRASSLGLQLVTSLVAQIGGRLDIQREGGTRFDIRFPGAAANGRQTRHD